MKYFILLLFFQPALLQNLLFAQKPDVFDVELYVNSNHDSVAFISLSDVYNFNGQADSIVLPPFPDQSGYEHYQHILLDSTYRTRFLSATNVLESDSVFLYDFAKNQLTRFPVKNLAVAALLNIYTDPSECPCPDFYYMIGFKIESNVDDYIKNSGTTLAYVGKESPFVPGLMKPVAWEQVEHEKFQQVAGKVNADSILKAHGYRQNYENAERYVYSGISFNYYIQNIVPVGQERIIARYLLVTDKITNKPIRTKVILHHESASPAPLNYVETTYIMQWAGRLFNNMPPVLLGLEYVSFGCPEIIILDPASEALYIHCDNRH